MDRYEVHEETALRAILKGISEINKPLALSGYFELHSERVATEWALYEIGTALENNDCWWLEAKK
jgi:hypothetical protein